MVSNKALTTLFLIILNMQRAVASSPTDPQEPSPSGKPAPLVKKLGRTPKTGEVLQDTTNNTGLVGVQEESTGAIGTSQELSVPLVYNHFKTLIEQGEYGKIFENGKEMNEEEFLEQLCPAIETLDQYKRIVDYLKGRNLVVSFYIYGDIVVVREAIVDSRIYDDDTDYFKDGYLEKALRLALEGDYHDRVIKLFDFRKGITAEWDGQLKQGKATSFGNFVYSFLRYLAPWGDGMALRRFFILRGEELRSKCPDILDTLCQKLVYELRGKLYLQSARELLVELIRQPFLLTPEVFVGGFLLYSHDGIRSAFLIYGWREAIQEGLKREYKFGGEDLWRVMKREQPDQYPGVFPETEEARAAACMRIPTKQQMEDEWIEKYEKWIKENALIFFNELNNLEFLPDVLWTIISEYAVTLADLEDLTASQE